MHFRPILFSVNFFNAFEVDFVLATLLDSASTSSQSSASESASQTPSNSGKDRVHSETLLVLNCLCPPSPLLLLQ